MKHYLDFEKPIAELQDKLAALSQQPTVPGLNVIALA